MLLETDFRRAHPVPPREVGLHILWTFYHTPHPSACTVARQALMLIFFIDPLSHIVSQVPHLTMSVL